MFQLRSFHNPWFIFTGIPAADVGAPLHGLHVSLHHLYAAAQGVHEQTAPELLPLAVQFEDEIHLR